MPPRTPHARRIQGNESFYASTAWRKLRHLKIKMNPLCEECERLGKLTPGRVVDHITPINQGGASLALDNLQTLCDKCHNKKSGIESHTR